MQHVGVHFWHVVIICSDGQQCHIFCTCYMVLSKVDLGGLSLLVKVTLQTDPGLAIP
jgi:hypothetical protein